MTRARAYYNEHDPYAAAWLRNLIFAGAIAPGDVDERDIRDVRPDDLRGYTQCHFFAGIGVWSHSLRRAGWRDETPVWTGSCPCQPFSAAGRGDGFADERHLWPAFHHLIRLCRPVTVLGEQVASAAGLVWVDLVQDDMEGEHYTFRKVDLPAAGVGAPNIRQRLWWVADAMQPGWAERRPVAGIGQAAGGGGAGELAGPDPSGCGGRPGSAAPGLPEREFAGEDHSGAGGVADAQGRGRRARRAGEPDGDRAQQSPGCGDAVGLDDAIGDGRRARRDDHREHDGFVPAAAGAHGILADTDEHRCASLSLDRGGAEERDLEPCRQLGDTGGAGLEVGSQPAFVPRALRIQGAAFGAAEPVRGFWRGSDWIWCRDGKYRPVEPGAFPLVNGLAADLGSDRPGEDSLHRIIIDPKTGRPIGQAPWRVGMLRGYGNAINAEAAAAFIRAVMDEREAAGC